MTTTSKDISEQRNSSSLRWDVWQRPSTHSQMPKGVSGRGSTQSRPLKLSADGQGKSRQKPVPDVGLRSYRQF